MDYEERRKWSKEQTMIEKRMKRLKEKEKIGVKANYGGKREGSGRKVIGKTQKVSVTLPHGDWERFDEVRGEQPRSAFIRELILKELNKGE